MGKRPGALLLILAAVAAIVAAPAAAGAATNEIRICGEADDGLTVAAGNYPAGGIPKTECSFAWATSRAVHRRADREELTPRFGLRVRGHRLGCRYSRGSLEETRCRDRTRFVLLYRSL